MKKVFRKRATWKHAALVFLIAISAFLAFEPLFKILKQSPAQEFASAMFGTIFAAVITMVLLSKQSETEEEKSRSEKVFEEKLELYNQAIGTLENLFKKVDVNHRTKVDRADIVELEFILARLIMVADEKTIHEFRLIYRNITRNYSLETGMLNLTSTDKHTVFRFSDYCREELGLSDKNIEKEILEDIVLDGELFYHLEEEDQYSPDLLSILKEIYGFLVFDLSVPLQRISFLSDGFEAHKKRVTEEPFVKCRISEEGLAITLSHTDHKLRHFKFDENKTLHVAPGDRVKFMEDFATLQKNLEDGQKG